MIDLRFQRDVLEKSGMTRDEAVLRVVRSAVADPSAPVDWHVAGLVLSSLSDIREATTAGSLSTEESASLAEWSGETIAAVRRAETQEGKLVPPASRREPVRKIVRQLLDEFLADHPLLKGKIDLEVAVAECVQAAFGETGPSRGESKSRGKSDVLPSKRAAAGVTEIAASLSQRAERRYAERHAAAERAGSKAAVDALNRTFGNQPAIFSGGGRLGPWIAID